MNFLKKTANVLLILFGIVLILLCADLLTNKTVNTSYDALGATDRDALDEICGIISLFDERKGNPDIWDESYNLSDTGCVLVRGYGPLRGYCYVVNTSLPANIFSQRIDMPENYSDITVYRMALCTPSLLGMFSTSFEDGHMYIDNEEVYAVRYDVSSVKYKGADSLEEAYVKNTFADAVETEDMPKDTADVSFVMSEENIALTGLQYRIIDELLAADNKEDADELLCEYVLVREYQASRYHDFAAHQEKTEFLQGREQYVFYNVSSLTGNNMTYFNKEKSDRITFYSAYHYLCTGRYNSDINEYFDHTGSIYTGAALCEVMHRFGVISDWERQLDNSTETDFVSQYSLIKEYCSDKEYENMTLENIQRAYNYEEILSMARTMVKGNADS